MAACLDGWTQPRGHACTPPPLPPPRGRRHRGLASRWRRCLFPPGSGSNPPLDEPEPPWRALRPAPPSAVEGKRRSRHSSGATAAMQCQGGAPFIYAAPYKTSGARALVREKTEGKKPAPGKLQRAWASVSRLAVAWSGRAGSWLAALPAGGLSPAPWIPAPWLLGSPAPWLPGSVPLGPRPLCPSCPLPWRGGAPGFGHASRAKQGLRRGHDKTPPACVDGDLQRPVGRDHARSGGPTSAGRRRRRRSCRRRRASSCSASPVEAVCSNGVGGRSWCALHGAAMRRGQLYHGIPLPLSAALV